MQARTEFDQAGVRLWAYKAQAELPRIGGRSPEGGLTPSERRVADLVASGRTNAEVAAAMFISTKTVAAHLTQICAKIGVRTRGELIHRLNTDTL